MSLFKQFHGTVVDSLLQLISERQLPAGLELDRVGVEPPRDPAHGDLATNAAMVLAKPAGMAPRRLAEMLAERLANQPAVVAVEVAGPGFINLRLADSVWRGQLVAILQAGAEFGRSEIGAGRRVNVEYVSANPTGPLHLAHARGAVIGDVLASLLAKAGYDVAREYYINDAGGQVDTLARSTYLRYREALGEIIVAIPEGFYPGEYLKTVGAALAARDGGKWLDRTEEEWLAPVRRFATEAMMASVRSDLDALGVHHDIYSSERAVIETGGVDRVLRELERRDLLYTGVLDAPKGRTPDDWEPRPQKLFRATQFGDDVDRSLCKSDGSWTYFAADIAYHLDKFKRGFPIMIDIWGADHGGYIKRMQAAVSAVTDGKGSLDVKICQLVRLLRAGHPVKMSKRAGTFVTLRELIDEVGRDVVRFIMLTRKNDAPLDFDLAKVLEQSRENPVFYVQYAHARICSVLRHAQSEAPNIDCSLTALASAPLGRLTHPDELGLIKLMAGWPRIIETAAEAHEPHRLAFYLYELAAAFHGLWNKGMEDGTLRFLHAGDPELSTARLALIRAVALVIASGLGVFGVRPVEEMR